jgi:hypothetical protein
MSLGAGRKPAQEAAARPGAGALALTGTLAGPAGAGSVAQARRSEICGVPGLGGSPLRAGASRPIPASEASEHSGGGELGTDLPGTGMAEFAEDVDSLPPCRTRGIDVPVVVVDVAKEGERLRLAFGFADLPVQVAGLLIAGNGLVPVAEAAVDVGNAVHRVCGAHGVV